MGYTGRAEAILDRDASLEQKGGSRVVHGREVSTGVVLVADVDGGLLRCGWRRRRLSLGSDGRVRRQGQPGAVGRGAVLILILGLGVAVRVERCGGDLRERAIVVDVAPAQLAARRFLGLATKNASRHGRPLRHGAEFVLGRAGCPSRIPLTLRRNGGLALGGSLRSGSGGRGGCGLLLLATVLAILLFARPPTLFQRGRLALHLRLPLGQLPLRALLLADALGLGLTPAGILLLTALFFSTLLFFLTSLLFLTALLLAPPLLLSSTILGATIALLLLQPTRLSRSSPLLLRRCCSSGCCCTLLGLSLLTLCGCALLLEASSLYFRTLSSQPLLSPPLVGLPLLSLLGLTLLFCQPGPLRLHALKLQLAPCLRITLLLRLPGLSRCPLGILASLLTLPLLFTLAGLSFFLTLSGLPLLFALASLSLLFVLPRVVLAARIFVGDLRRAGARVRNRNHSLGRAKQLLPERETGPRLGRYPGRLVRGDLALEQPRRRRSGRRGGGGLGLLEEHCSDVADRCGLLLCGGFGGWGGLGRWRGWRRCNLTCGRLGGTGRLG
eukprot:m.72303 g.72303  ORF g.72303 m.72303 type:complete len:555 (+) comp7675_c0_seq2:19-1683(+)